MSLREARRGNAFGARSIALRDEILTRRQRRSYDRVFSEPDPLSPPSQARGGDGGWGGQDGGALPGRRLWGRPRSARPRTAGLGWILTLAGRQQQTTPVPRAWQSPPAPSPPGGAPLSPRPPHRMGFRAGLGRPVGGQVARDDRTGHEGPSGQDPRTNVVRRPPPWHSPCASFLCDQGQQLGERDVTRPSRCHRDGLALGRADRRA
jgi:hypothetical protein